MIFGAMHKLTGGSKWFNMVASSSVAMPTTSGSPGADIGTDSGSGANGVLASSLMATHGIEPTHKSGDPKRNEVFYSSFLDLTDEAASTPCEFIPASIELHIASQLEYLDMIANAEPVAKRGSNKDRIRYLVSLFQLTQQAPAAKKTTGSLQSSKERKVSRAAIHAAASLPSASMLALEAEESPKASTNDLLTSSLEMSAADIIKSSFLALSPEPQYIHVASFPSVFPAGSKRKGILKFPRLLRPNSLTMASPDSLSLHSGCRSCSSSPSSYGSCQELLASRTKRRVAFNPLIHVGDAIPCSEYERKGEYIAKSLTPEIAYFIKKELNQIKSDMYIHEDSRCNTQFYVI